MSVEIVSAEVVWQQCLDIIEDNINYQKFRTWFSPIKPVGFEDQVLTIQVPSQFFYEWLEEHYYEVLQKTIHKVLGTDGKLEYSILVERSADEFNTRSVRLPQQPVAPVPNEQRQNSGLGVESPYPNHIHNPFVIPGVRRVNIDSNLNPNYVFERYIEGDCNKLARSAALAIADKPGNNAFNPFFLYGGVGLGKTHLVQSIGNRVRQAFKDEKNVLYISSESFTNEFVHAIRNNRAREFSMFYRNIDVLIIDDIQFFSGKEKTQEEFFHIFNALHQEGKQIILSSDRAPKDIPDIQERLLSRFNWGLSADLQIPEFETRYAILERKASDNGIDFDAPVLEFIAQNFKSSIRDMEGAIIRLLAASSLQDMDHIDIKLAKTILKDLIKETKVHISIESIQNHVCEYFNLEPNKLREKTRKQEVVEARQIAMYLAKYLTKSSLKTIGLHFGGRDHSTVIHAVTTIAERQKTTPKFQRMVNEIQTRIELSSM